jgi:hypothetical protein
VRPKSAPIEITPRSLDILDTYFKYVAKIIKFFLRVSASWKWLKHDLKGYLSNCASGCAQLWLACGMEVRLSKSYSMVLKIGRPSQEIL